MKANVPGPMTVEETVNKIKAIYGDVIKKEVTRAVIMGGHAIFEILYDCYVLPIDNAKNPEEKENAVNDLIGKIRKEAEEIKKRKAEAEEKQEEKENGSN